MLRPLLPVEQVDEIVAVVRGGALLRPVWAQALNGVLLIARVDEL